MSKIPVATILERCAVILEENRARAVAALRPRTTQAPAPGQVFSCLELFHMQDYSLNYNSFSVTPDKKLATDWAVFDPAIGCFIPGLPEYLAEVFATEYSEDEGIDFTARHEAQLFAWFSTCWDQAGGRTTRIPTYFCFEKEYQCRDLSTGEIMTEEEVANRLGHGPVTAG
jgi:hypothetical protein